MFNIREMTRRTRSEFCQDQYQLRGKGGSHIASAEEQIGEQDLEAANTDNSFKKHDCEGIRKDNS